MCSKFKRKPYFEIVYAQNLDAYTVWISIRPFLHGNVFSDRNNKKSIERLLLKVLAVLRLDPLEEDPFKTKSHAELFCEFQQTVESRNRLEGDTYKTLRTVLDILINSCGIISEAIRSYIVNNGIAEIQTVPKSEFRSRQHDSSLHLIISTSTLHVSKSGSRSSRIWKIVNCCLIALIACIVVMGPKETALLILSVIKYFSPSIFALNFDQSQNVSVVNATTMNFTVQDFNPVSLRIPAQDPSSAPYESSTSASSILTVTANPNVVFKIPATKRSISSSFISFTTPSPVYSTVTPSHLYTHVVTVSSYQDYLQFMRKIPSNKIIKVAIKLQSQFDWPDNASIASFNSLEISALLLDGPFSLDIIIQIIQQTTNLEELHLHNSNNQLCARNQGQLNLLKLSKYKVYLPMLKKLILENFESCMEMYEMLATMLEPTEAFQTFAMSIGIVDNRNVFAIERLLKSNQKSINALVFQETEFSSTFPVFARGLIMPEVKMIRWDSVTSTEDKGYLNIDPDFCNTFPKLQLLYSKFGYMHWSNVLKLAKCKKLRKLHLTVETTHHNSQDCLSILEQNFPHLRYVDVKLFNTNGSNIGRWLKKNKRQ